MRINQKIIKNFAEKFGATTETDVSRKYVFIGGTALMLLALEADYEDIRGTKDYDIVLLVKESAGNKELFQKLWEYIEAGGYRTFQTKEGIPQYYRFVSPENTTEYPEQLEFFSTSPSFITGYESRFAPLHVDDDVQSLSSILMDDSYYEFILHQCRVIDNVNCVTEIALIALKAKAYNDLSARKKAGENISSKTIDKHRKDIIRVLEIIPQTSICKLDDFPEIKEEIHLFIKNIEKIHSKDDSIKVGSIQTNILEITTSLKKHYDLI